MNVIVEIIADLQEVICNIDSLQSPALDKRDADVKFGEIRMHCAEAHSLLDELDLLIGKGQQHEHG